MRGLLDVRAYLQMHCKDPKTLDLIKQLEQETLAVSAQEKQLQPRITDHFKSK